MNVKRFLIAAAAVFVLFQVFDFVVHGMLLAPVYRSMMSVWRQDMMSLMWVMWITGAVMSLFFVYIFIKGYERRGMGEGLRYGVVIGLFMSVGAFNQYVVYPITLSLAAQWFIYGIVEFIAAGLVTAAIYRPKAS